MAGCKELVSYSLDATLEADRTDDNCFIIDVGCDKDGDCVSSPVHIAEMVDSFRSNVNDFSSTITKLYVIGEWNPVLCKGKGRATKEKDENKNSNYARLEKEHHEAGVVIAKLVEQMPALKELT